MRTDNKKHIIKKIIMIGMPSLLLAVMAGFILVPGLKMALHLDFSQEYRKVQGADSIRFLDNWSGKIYDRAFWGLRSVGSLENRIEDSERPPEMSGDEDVQTVSVADGGLWYGYDSEEERIFLGHLVGEVEETYDTQYSVSQVALSPDERYILYCEIEYGVNGGYSTDEEYCYYRAIDRESGETYTVYSGYREWYRVYWEASDYLTRYYMIP